MTARAAFPRRVLLALLASAGALSLAACATDGATKLAEAQSQAPTPLDQWPMKAGQAPVELALASHAGGLSPNQRAMLADAARRWREGGGGPVLVRAPEAAGPNSLTARQAADALVASGVPHGAVRLASYPEPRGDAPVVVSFMAYAPEVADCSGQWGNLMSTRTNNVPGNYGCAVHANMALQVADPHDIVEPRPMDMADGTRRADVLAKYRTGKKTSTERDDQAKGTLSQVAQ